jgi:ketosteroid isomerase-like protein
MPLDEKNQETMRRYYERTNVGDFIGALEFLSEDVVYTIPGPPARVPYSGEWRGKNRVMLCFEAFNAAFGLVDMAETRTVAGPAELFSINDEIFVSRSTGRPWRVGVVHHMTFDDDHLIARLDNYTDMAAAVQALAGQTAITVPMLPPGPLPGEGDVSAERARAVVERHLRSGPGAADLLDENVTALVPGDPRRLRFAGTWRGRAEFATMANYYSAAFDVDETSVEHVLAENGGVAVVTALRGTFLPTGARVDVRGVDFYQITGDGRIGRLARYFDTHQLTGA